MASACLINWWLILEFLKVILSWPVITGIGFIFLMIKCLPEIKALINRIDSAEFPGGKITAQQEKLKQEATIVPIQSNTEPQLEKLTLDEAQVQEIKQILEAEQATARIWEYRYLNYFFAYNTQTVLDWLISLDSVTTISAYDTYWMSTISLAAERQAVIEALQRHHLIVCLGNTISVTPKGKEYAQWSERRILNAAG